MELVAGGAAGPRQDYATTRTRQPIDRGFRVGPNADMPALLRDASTISTEVNTAQLDLVQECGRLLID
jgi:hypothetical protein